MVTTYSPVDEGAGAAPDGAEDETNECDADDEMALPAVRDGDGHDVFLSAAFITTGTVPFLPPTRAAKPVMIPSSQFASNFATLAAPRLVVCPLMPPRSRIYLFVWYVVTVVAYDDR